MYMTREYFSLQDDWNGEKRIKVSHLQEEISPSCEGFGHLLFREGEF